MEFPHERKSVMLMIDPPIPNRFEGIARFAREHGWRLTLANRLVRAPSGWSGDGALVTIRSGQMVVRFAEDLVRRNIPVVDLTYHRPEIDVPRVVPDYRGAGRLAARHFSGIGLRRTAWFSTAWSNVQRLFFDGLSEGAPMPPVRFVLSEMMSGSRLDDPDRFASAMAPKLEALGKPAGILAYNDEEASRLEALCLDIGLKVPDEIAILGIGDDAFLCENQPVPLSSVDDELERNGYEAAALLQSLMDGNPAPAAPTFVPCVRVKTRRSTDTLAAENPVLRKALRILDARLANPPGMKRLALEAGVSRATLDRLFMRELGVPAHEALKRRRLAKAKEMLLESDLDAGEISSLCGFCNPGYFSAAFRKSEGMPPGRWRKEHLV